MASKPIEEGEIEPEPTIPAEKLCNICKEKEFKYKCPSCNEKTCCLQCVKQHKKLKKCMGVTKPSKYISLNSYDVNTLSKDINFIENGITKVNESRKTTAETQDKVKIDKKWKFLRYFCRKWRNIALKLAPSIFKRHQNNQSYYHQGEKTIFWTLEFKIVCQENGEIQDKMHTILLHEPVNENFAMKDIIKTFVEDKTKYYSENHLFLNELKDTKLSDPSKINAYVEVPNSEEFKTLITPKKPGSGEEQKDVEAKNIPAQNQDNYDIKIHNTRVVRVDKVKSLKEVFENTIVNEYPSVYLVI